VEPGETVLSDVHVKCKLSIVGENSTLVSRFPFRVRASKTSCPIGDDVDGDDETGLKASKDGDVGDSDVIIIRHLLQTSLKEVGLQVWSGCLLLADFLLTHPDLSQTPNETWLELGAGTGLCSIVAALSRSKSSPPNRIICTDTGEKVLHLCRVNLTENISLLEDRNVSTKLCLAEVNFLNFDEKDRKTDVYDARADQDEFDVTLLPLLRQASVILAADVIFDADVTEGFFQLLVEAMTVAVEEEERELLFPKLENTPSRKLSKTLYLALEKRVLFSIYEDEPSSPIYEHFRACLDGLLRMQFETGTFEAEKMDTDFQQCFYKSYERNNYLELWRIRFLFH